MNIEVRKATFEDIDKGLLNVFIEGYRFHQNGRPDIFSNISDETLKEDLIKNFENMSIIVILDNNIVIGYLSYQIKEKHTKKLTIEHLIITQEYRGCGLGKKLINEVKNIAINTHCDRIELNCWMFNTNALAMYEHLGFDRQRIIYEMKI